MIAYAQQDAEHIVAAKGLLARIEDAIVFPLITLFMAIAILIFMWGAYQYMYGAMDGSSKEDGRSHMLWGIIGFTIMLSAMGLLRIAANTFGVDTGILD
jgi:hypothetical protein